MRTIVVSHAGGRYEVLVAPGLLSRLGDLVAAALPGRRLASITDEHVAAALERAGIRLPGQPSLVVPPGEGSKSRERWAALTDALLDAGMGRDGALLAVGGGVVSDLAGFVAATLHRGVPFVAAPTSLLAMVDAAVGGKVGVDTPHGKNLVGAFHAPALVVADPEVLRSLPDRVFREGLAEAVKHGLVADGAYFEWMEQAMPSLLARDPEPLAHLVARSVELKAAIVSDDEREQGRRAILNAGHTVAHALERASRWTLPHGEAVAIGLVVESHLATQLAGLDPAVPVRLASLLRAAGLPVRLPPAWRHDDLLAAARLDKKNRHGSIHCALPTALGGGSNGGSWTHPVSPEQLLGALRAHV